MKKSLRAWRWPLGLGILLLTAYGLAAALWVPPFARAELQTYVSERLQRQLALGRVTFNPFTLTLRVSPLSLSERDGTPLVSVAQLAIGGDGIASLWHRAPVLDVIELTEPRVRAVVRSDGTLNLADLTSTSGTRTSRPQATSAPVRIDRLIVHRGALELIDRTRKRPLTTELAPIELALEDLRTDDAHENVHRLKAALPGGGELTWEGRLSLTPLGAKGSFEARGVAAKALDDYLDEQPYRLAAGSLDFAGTYRLAALPKLSFEVVLATIEAQDLAIASRNEDAKAPLLLAAATVRNLTLAWPTQSIRVQALGVREPSVRLVRGNDGMLNLARWFAASSDSSTSAPSNGTTQTTPWRLDVEVIDIEQGKLSFDDESTLPTVHVEMTPFALAIRRFSTAASGKTQVSGSGRVNGTGSVTTQGHFRLMPFAATLEVTGSDMPLEGLQPYLVQRAAATLHSGKLSLEGRLEMTAPQERPASITFSGGVRVDDLRATDNALNEDLLKWRRVELSGVDLSVAPDRLNVDQVLAEAPFGRLTIGKDSVLNLTRVLRPHTPIPAATSTSIDAATLQASSTERPAPGFPVNIRRVEVVDGSASFVDYSIEPTFSAVIDGLQGSLSELSSVEDARATLRIEGQVDRYAPVTLVGQANWLAPTKYADLDINFRNMDLTTLNPYAGKFAGYNVTKGKLSSELKYRVVAGRIEGQHRLILDSLELGRATGSKEAVSLPVKLAVSLLKNRKQVIELNLPMRGSVGDPELRFGSIMRKVFVGLLTKVAASPFKLFGAPFGGGEELAYIEFAPGAATLLPSEHEKLAKLSQMLREKSKLELSIPLNVAPYDDAMGYARLELARRVPAPTNPVMDELAKKQRIAALELAYAADLGEAAPPAADPDLDLRMNRLEMQLLTAYMPNEKQLEALGRARADAIENALLASRMILPERVFKTQQHPATMMEGQVRLALELR